MTSACFGVWHEQHRARGGSAGRVQRGAQRRVGLSCNGCPKHPSCIMLTNLPRPPVSAGVMLCTGPVSDWYCTLYSCRQQVRGRGEGRSRRLPRAAGFSSALPAGASSARETEVKSAASALLCIPLRPSTCSSAAGAAAAAAAAAAAEHPQRAAHLRHIHARHLRQRQQQLAARRRTAPVRCRQLLLRLLQALCEGRQQVLSIACRR